MFTIPTSYETAIIPKIVMFKAYIINQSLACEQAPGEPEQSDGACRHSIDAAVL